MSGTTTATLQIRLNEARDALHAILTGQRIASIQYGGLGGNQAVTYSATDVGALRSYIAQLEMQLGVTVRARRAIGVRF